MTAAILARSIPLFSDALPTGTDLRPETDLSSLRIAFISGNYNCVRDGANQAQNILVRFLLDRGVAVRVYSPTCEEPAFEPVGDLVSIPSIPMPFGRKEYRMAWRLPGAICDNIVSFAPNLFHVSLPFLHGRSALKLAQRMDVPVIGAMHTRFETYPRYYGLGLLERPVSSVLRRFYKACDQVVVPSQSIVELMQAQGMSENLGIWTRGVDPRIFRPDRRDVTWRRSQGFSEDVPVIAFVGRLVAEKGLDDFAEIVGRLRQEGAAFGVLVIGDGPAGPEFKNKLGDARFTGFLQGEALARAIASADVLLNPSSTEAFSNVSLEAMACGLPVVAASAAGNSDLVTDGVTGALVRSGDIDGYVSAIRSYIGDAALRRLHASNALAKSRTLSWDCANEGILTAYFAALTLTSRTSSAI